MTDRPILFSAPMVRALLDGRKTQTRRVLKPQPHLMSDEGLSYIGIDGKGHEPRTRAGDRLYVREHWRTSGSLDSTAPRDLPRTAAVLYNADENRPVWVGKHRQAMHMPRWASRITLIVTDVRVERLMSISETDARAEGFPISWDGKPYDPPPPEIDIWQGYGRASFLTFWAKLHGHSSWDENPWVVAYSFRTILQNIDQIEKAAA